MTTTEDRLTTDELGQIKGLTLDEARSLINEHIARGLENIPGGIIRIYGLEAEYPELIAKLDAEEKK